MKKKTKKYNKTNENYFYKVQIKAIKDLQLLSFLSDPEWKVLSAIASFIDSSNFAYPSQRHLSVLTGKNISTISRIISSLSKKEFQGEIILHIEKKKEKGNKFANNRYTLSPQIGLSFGKRSHNSTTEIAISQYKQANKNKTLNKIQKINKNQTSSSFKKIDRSDFQELLQKKEQLHIEQDDTFLFYAKQISKQKGIDNDIQYAKKILHKNIKDMGEENWIDLVKTLKRHPKPCDLLNYLRYKISQKGLTYEEAWKEWDKKH